jgi:protein-S-isoprenylcysteine O-methyltransferase Ste14
VVLEGAFRLRLFLSRAHTSGRANPAAIAGACAVVLGVALFVLLYEQPTLRRKFGADYEEYCRNVGPWIPRLRAWKK